MSFWWSKRDPSVFWSWFAANRSLAEAVVRQATGSTNFDATALDKDMAPIHAALHKYDKRLAFELGKTGETGEYDLVISAEGNPAAFTSVFALVKTAPLIDGWRITALKPRRIDGSIKLHLGDQQFSTSDLRFHAQPDADVPNQFTLLFLADIEPALLQAHWNAIQQLGQLTAQSHLGEHDLARYVSQTAVVGLAAFKARWEHDGQPLSELQAMFPPLAMH